MDDELNKWFVGFLCNENNPSIYNFNIEKAKPVKLVDWVINLNIDYDLFNQEKNNIVNDMQNNNMGIILSFNTDNMHNEFDIKSFIREKGYINDVELENNTREMSPFSCLKKTLMIFRKIHYYRQDNYNLCLLYNKPEHLNDYIKKLPNIYNIGEYIYDYRRFFTACDKNSFMIDIGANIGLSACPVLSLGYTVVCFEPEILNVNILEAIKKYNNYKNMFIEDCAVIGLKNTTSTTFYSNVNREDNSSVNQLCCVNNVCPKNTIIKTVKSITLDEWYDKNKSQFELCNLRLIKIDVQGGELEILKGAVNLLKYCSTYGKCILEIECDEGFMKILNINFDTINNFLNSCNYVCIKKGYDCIFVPKT